MNVFSFFIIIAILLVNFLLYKKDYINKKLFYISNFFIIMYSILAIVIFYNNISNGFSTGILF
ncbi:MAG: hypothetical protein E7G24_09185, partial [Clostridium celatum]|nr:hypothetical protein [Clostridium celatum]